MIMEKRAEILELLFKETHNHMGTSPTPCIYEHQFDEIVEKIHKIYNEKGGVRVGKK